MTFVVPAVAAAAALALGAPPRDAATGRAVPHPVDLACTAGAGALDRGGLASELARGAGRADATPPPCLGDVCQPVVSVPGFEPRYGRAHRSELFVLALDRAHVEPLASIAWALVATGVRLDWTPPALDGPNVDGRGWGSVMVRLRVRIDATNHLVFPRRPGDVGERQRPARRSST